MKKILATILLAAITLAIPATTDARMRWGATAGVTVSTLSFSQDLVPVHSVVGYSAGITGEKIFPGIGIGIDLGLMYDQQGAKVDLGTREVWASQGIGNDRVTIHSIKIPIHLRWKYTRLNGLEDKIAPLVYAGPEINFCVGHTNGRPYKFSHGDIGIAVGLGFELFKHWQFTGGYIWGVTSSLNTKVLDDYTADSRQWTVRVAYYF